MKALVFERRGYTIAHTDVCYVILGPMKPTPVPLRCHGGIWPVGTRFTYLGGTKGSAGYPHLSFEGFEPMTYVGMIRTVEDGRLACFVTGDAPEGGFFAYAPTQWGLMYSTHARSGRCIGMTRAQWLPPLDPAAAGRAGRDDDRSRNGNAGVNGTDGDACRQATTRPARVATDSMGKRRHSPPGKTMVHEKGAR